MPAKKGSIPWNKGKKCPQISKSLIGRVHTPETIRKLKQSHRGKKMPQTSGDKHWNWAGSEVGISGVHKWVRKILGIPNECENCGRKNIKCEWANISGKYLRDISDWARLCYICHDLFDDVGFHKAAIKK